ncbi:hypothetical protein H5T87_06625 [bacterium]|nr:hypothetical protein [bacterium]
MSDFLFLLLIVVGFLFGWWREGKILVLEFLSAIISLILATIIFTIHPLSITGFILLFLLLALLLSELPYYLFKSFFRKDDGIIGKLLGGFLGMVLFFFLSGALALLNPPSEKSPLAMLAEKAMPRLIILSEKLHIDPPKLVYHPSTFEGEWSSEGLWEGRIEYRFERFAFSQLDGSTCIACRGKVKFLGYFRKGRAPLVPKFQCTVCGRTSDGCQTFEGFHKIYGICPVEEAEKGVELDCGTWTNGNWVVPKGKCPVCGREYRPPLSRILGH